ncbi:MAG: hypothetical protein GY898_17260, partial [Proteobacteria bacterium]|nr:hypothetical protein [Pseudomonadota bacterium]
MVGQPPFAGADSTLAVLHAHLQRRPPILADRPGFPVGFKDWIATLLEKRPAARFAQASDAARALSALSPTERLTQAPAPSAPAFDDSETVSLLDLTDTLEESDLPFTASASFEAVPFSELRRAPVKVPADWQDETAPRGYQLLGAGTGLFGLRTIPMVGRIDERNRLWEVLRSVADDETPRAIRLAGPPGAGKSRLADWLCTRAHELGVAITLRAAFGDGSSVEEAVAGLLADHLGIGGLEAPAALDRVTARTGPEDAERLVALS